MPIPAEEIPGGDAQGRLIFLPSMYREGAGLIWQVIFQFPTDAGGVECLVWSKYAAIPDGMHAIGRADESKKKERKPEAAYLGFITSTADAIRAITTHNGNGFSLTHATEEGDHHVNVTFRSANNGGAIPKGEKNDLKLRLRNVFGPLVPVECVQPAPA